MYLDVEDVKQWVSGFKEARKVKQGFRRQGVGTWRCRRQAQ